MRAIWLVSAFGDAWPIEVDTNRRGFARTDTGNEMNDSERQIPHVATLSKWSLNVLFV